MRKKRLRTRSSERDLPLSTENPKRQFGPDTVTKQLPGQIHFAMEECNPSEQYPQACTPYGLLPIVPAARKRRARSNSIRPQGIHLQKSRQNGDEESEAIPSLDFSRRVCADDARIDKILLKCNLGIAEIGHEDDYPMFRNCLRDTEGRVFTTAPDQGAGTRPIEIRKSDYTQGGKALPTPLFRGRLKTIKQQGFVLLSTELFLNPTRAIRFFPRMTGRKQGVFETAEKPTEPRTLDRKSNCLPASITRRAYRMGEKRHFENVLHRVVLSCSEAAQMVELPVWNFNASDFCLKYCEFYFEFHRSDAVETLRSLTKSLFSFGGNAALREHAPLTEANEMETSENAESVKLRLSKTEHIVVYAKTAQRLRFEVRFSKPSTNIVRSCSSPGLRGFFAILDTLRVRAASRINEVFAFLQEASSLPSATIASDWRYQKAWHQRLGWSAVSCDFLQTLRLKGSLFVRQPTIAERKLIRKAKTAKLVRFIKQRGCYVPCAEAISISEI